LKAKIGECETKSKIKNNGDFNNFMKCYKPRTSTADNEKGELVGGSHSILAK
jgi:hypothetical protein